MNRARPHTPRPRLTRAMTAMGLAVALSFGVTNHAKAQDFLPSLFEGNSSNDGAINKDPERAQPNVRQIKDKSGRVVRYEHLPQETALIKAENAGGEARAKAALSAKGFKEGAPVFIRALKEEGELELWIQKNGAFRLFKTYKIQKLSGDLGPKLKKGDKQGVEGFYDVTTLNFGSLWGRSFEVSYPNAYDRALGRSGGDIFVHGFKSSAGCFAMGPDIYEIFYIVRKAKEAGHNIKLHSFPFRMTKANLDRHASSPHIGFWRSLAVGYDHATDTQSVPDMLVERQGKRIAYVHPSAKKPNFQYVSIAGRVLQEAPPAPLKIEPKVVKPADVVPPVVEAPVMTKFIINGQPLDVNQFGLFKRCVTLTTKPREACDIKPTEIFACETMKATVTGELRPTYSLWTEDRVQGRADCTRVDISQFQFK